MTLRYGTTNPDHHVTRANIALREGSAQMAEMIKDRGFCAGVFVGIVPVDGFEMPVWSACEGVAPVTFEQCSEMSRILALQSKQYENLALAIKNRPQTLTDEH
jgi:hypothetical protein